MFAWLARFIEHHPGLHKLSLLVWRLFPPRMAGFLKGLLARKWLEDRRKAPGASKPADQPEVQTELFASPVVEGLERVRRELQEILKLLK